MFLTKAHKKLVNFNQLQLRFYFCYIQTYFILTFYVVVMILYIIILIHYIHIFFFFGIYNNTSNNIQTTSSLYFSYFCLYSTHSTVLVLLPRVEFKFSVRPTSLFLFIKLHSLTSFSIYVYI